ncbi:MAG TPA: hypothetical protein PKN36_03180 [bacterium]|nr:hypothetical protein [bacterium]
MNTENKEAAKKLNVMIIEDDDTIRKLLAIEFKRRGHNVLEYTDAAAAMLDIKREPRPAIDAGIVDLMNMGYGGNMGDYMRTLKEYRSIAILYYTALTRQQFNTKILEKPNTHYVHKVPGSIQQVVEKIESIC